jgi:hypothetical protein
MAIIESLRTYIATCPFLDSSGRVSVDFLGSEPTEYSVDPVPANIILEEFIDGSSNRQYVFVFTSREPYGSDTLQNMVNSGFYERFANWLDEQSKLGNLPTLESGTSAYKIAANSLGYIIEGETDSAKYQIQCSLEYYKEGV